VGNRSSSVTCPVNSNNVLLVLISWLLNLAFVRPVKLSRAVRTYSFIAVMSFDLCEVYKVGVGSP
jgi:hypothetical protein